jgi:hypothetical protein
MTRLRATIVLAGKIRSLAGKIRSRYRAHVLRLAAANPLSFVRETCAATPVSGGVASTLFLLKLKRTDRDILVFRDRVDNSTPPALSVRR